MALYRVSRLIPHQSVCVLKLCENAQFVGLLTYMFRGFSQRLFLAFSGFPNDLLSQKRNKLHAYSTVGIPPCSGFAPDSLVQQNKNACPSISIQIAHLPQSKPGFMISALGRLLSFEHRPWGRGGVAPKKLSKGNQTALFGFPCKGGYTDCFSFSLCWACCFLAAFFSRYSVFWRSVSSK